ncbi:MAG: hypothetical protein Q4G49_00210, partial [Paracoccus sp. (in: a-proteobacteria)]|nr:hypothetical protein [Paracoccus sp. (in: a-proteobacteria)]
RKLIISAVAAIIVIGIPLGLWLINEYFTPLDILLDRVMDKMPFRSAISDLSGNVLAAPRA